MIWEITLASDFVVWGKSGLAITWDGRCVEGRKEAGFVLMIAAGSRSVVAIRAQGYTPAPLKAENGDINTIDQSINQ